MIHGYTRDEGHEGHGGVWGGGGQIQGVRIGDPRRSGVSAGSGRVTCVITCLGASEVPYLLGTEGRPIANVIVSERNLFCLGR